MNITTIGFDIAKGVIQIHDIDASGAVWRARGWRARGCRGLGR
jgi:hypothetical protein